MAAPQKEHGYAPIANELLEAMAWDPVRGLGDRITYWVLRHTYGFREVKVRANRKTCTYSWAAIARDIKAKRGLVGKAGRRLLASKRLWLDSRGRIGVQKDYEKWVIPSNRCRLRAPQTAPTQTAPRRTSNGTGRGRLRVGSSYARAQTVVQTQDRQRAAGAPTPIPDTHPDTPQSRAADGDPRRRPQDHPAYARLPYAEQEALAMAWEGLVAHQALWARTQELLARRKRQQEGTP